MKHRIHSEETLYKGWATLRRIDYELDPEGEKPVRTKGEYFDCGDGVACLAYHPHRHTILLVRQFRLAAALNGHSEAELIEVCAGKLGDKTPEEAIRAELYEELGYRIDQVQRVMSVFMSPGAVGERIHLYVAEYEEGMKAGTGGGLEEESERVEILEVPFEEAFGMIRDGRICDAKTVMLIQHARIHGLL